MVISLKSSFLPTKEPLVDVTTIVVDDNLKVLPLTEAPYS
jgi:hypothetical protein